ncbi:MAG TPA: hypothetical protein PK289_11155, partial [Bacteroidia bacterium]|nr:hypothetical protein [Bacteroidia bacterium]
MKIIKRLIIFFTILFLLIILCFWMFPIVGKLTFGTARIIGKEVSSVVYIDGQESSEAKLFYSASNFENTEKRDYWILYLRKQEGFNHHFPVLIIDKTNNQILIPNSGIDDYDIVLGYLLQSENGAHVMVSMEKDAIKSPCPERNTHLKINENNIEFTVCMNETLSKKIRIVMSGPM